MVVQEVRWDTGGTLRAEDYIFSLEKETKITNLEQDFFCTPLNSIRVQFVSDRTSSIVLRGHWCNITVLNVHGPTEEKSDKAKDICYEVFHHFPKYHMKIQSGKNCFLGV